MKTTSAKTFTCDTCGQIDHVLMDGYVFGDRILEGVMFKVMPDLSVSIAPENAEYFKDLNQKKWLKAAKEHAKENDIATCPKCQGDVDAQPTDQKATDE